MPNICRGSAIFAFILFSFAGPPAKANIILTVDPNDYAEGTNLTNAIDGVTISRLTRVGASTYEVVRSDIFASGSGQDSFGWTNSLGYLEECRQFGLGCHETERASGIEIRFDTPVDFFQFSFTGTVDGPVLYAYDLNDNLLDFSSANYWAFTCLNDFGPYPGNEYGNCSWYYPPSSDQFPDNRGLASFSSASRDISRVVVGGWSGGVRINEFSYSYSVPEPGTLALLGLGLVGMGYARRRKSH